MPALRTIERRIADLPAYDRAVAQYGIAEAERMFANQHSARLVYNVLDLVELDHSPVDALVVDENGVVVGRPTVTVVLERKSRCLLGYHLSLAGHGVAAVFAALRHALLPKTYLQGDGRYADLGLEWPCFGWFQVALMDNGSEFHAEAVADALTNLGITPEFAEAYSPNDKPFVERFLKTFNYCFIHRLPGTTLARVSERKGLKSEAEARLTMEDLDRAIHIWVCDRYHKRPHMGLDGRAPITVWNEGAQARPPRLKVGADQVDIEFSNVTESAVQHYGIDLNTFVYVSHRLLMLRRLLKRGQRVAVKWPEVDAGHVFVWDPIDREYFRVPNKNAEYAGLTVKQAKLAKKLKAENDPDYTLARVTAQVQIDALIDQAKQDKKLKQRRVGARLANETSEKYRQQAEDQRAADVSAIRAGSPVVEANDVNELADALEIVLPEGEE
jgi:putative transposase